MKMQRTCGLVAIAALALGAAHSPSFAETRPAPKGPPKTMGNEGELPSTSTMGSHVPTMGSTDAPAPAEGSTGPVTQKGPQKRMGDEGKLPATGTMGGAVPPMNNN